jgi:DNA-binding transcriptional regulator LsrR (DeoR family)
MRRSKMANRTDWRSLSERKKNELAVRIAELYYHEEKSLVDIAELLNLGDPRRAKRFLKYAREVGIVDIRVSPEIAPLLAASPRVTRDKNLERALIRVFQLHGAIVVDAMVEGEYTTEEDNHLHIVLGRALGEYLRPIIGSGAHIGVCGGRGAFYTAESLRISGESVPFPQKDIKVTALAGSVFARPPGAAGAKRRLFFDADDVAISLAAAFQDAEVRLLSIPVASFDLWPSAERDFVPKYAAERVIAAWEWEKEAGLVPNLALVGLGVLNDYHRFLYEEVLEYELSPIKDDLVKLRDQAAGMGCRIGDIAYKLFLIGPPDGKAIRGASEVENLINTINRRIMAPTPGQLRKIDRVIAIAGGEYKHGAIWTVLTSDHLKGIVTDLCTDKGTAQFLVEKGMEEEIAL